MLLCYIRTCQPRLTHISLVSIILQSIHLFDHCIDSLPNSIILLNSTIQDSTPASEGNSQRSPNQHGQRKSEKRRHSSPRRQQSSLSSATTNTSEESVKTTGSSNYRPISPPGPAPILGNHLGRDVIRDRCHVGFSGAGGMGSNTLSTGPTLRKRSKVSPYHVE
ncbi:hypothetical protein AHF37_00969 [Paragonimus kellicotti]|nr:hypothetical protein AHF37_00969 [Paragonimus kellicotti]